ncbi:MAG: VWA domain-containing protein [Verrucomicrobiales bacterium]|nr:VWA domain-containing protein [Verrucomicrobiales bacterium]
MNVLPTGLSFATPIWFWALLALLPLLGLRLWAQFSTRKQLPGLVSPRLQSQLISGKGQAQRWFVFFLHALAFTAIIAALARPQLGFDEVETETEGRNLIIAIDTSRSMLANDLQPDRLSRAKLAAMDIVRSLPEDRIGLIAFAGRPFLQAPLTVDHEAILESIDQLDTEIIPRGGTNLAAAVGLARDTFEESETEQSALMLFSDGEALEGEAEVAEIRKAAKEAGMTIITVGVGTASGAIIPELNDRGQVIPGEFVKDETGQVVRTRLDPEALRALASDGGIYIHLGGTASLTQVVSQIQSGIAISREESEASLRPIERFMWPLSIAFVCLVLSHFAPMLFRSPRRSSRIGSMGTTASAAALILFLSGSGTVRADDPLFVGHENFENQKYEEAIQVYEGALSEGVSRSDEHRLQMGIGASAFRTGDFERAEDAFGQALVESKPGIQEQAHYNLGNTLFRKGEAALQSLQKQGTPDGLQTMTAPAEMLQSTIQTWESAIEHYESALSLNPENHRAPHNIEVVKKKIEELKKQQEEQEKQEQEKEEQEKEDEKEQEEEEEDKEEEEEDKEDEKGEEDEKEEGEGESKPDDSSDPGEQEKNQEEKNDEQNPEDKSEDSEQEGDQNEGENESEKEDSGDSENNSEEEQQNGDQKEQPAQPESGGEEPEDGKLEANPNQAQPQEQASDPGQAQPMEQRNAETGYSPSEARQLLRALADETEVRPILKPSRGERFKNW